MVRAASDSDVRLAPRSVRSSGFATSDSSSLEFTGAFRVCLVVFVGSADFLPAPVLAISRVVPDTRLL